MGWNVRLGVLWVLEDWSWCKVWYSLLGRHCLYIVRASGRIDTTALNQLLGGRFHHAGQITAIRVLILRVRTRDTSVRANQELCGRGKSRTLSWYNLLLVLINSCEADSLRFFSKADSFLGLRVVLLLIWLISSFVKVVPCGHCPGFNSSLLTFVGVKYVSDRIIGQATGLQDVAFEGRLRGLLLDNRLPRAFLFLMRFFSCVTGHILNLFINSRINYFLI